MSKFLHTLQRLTAISRPLGYVPSLGAFGVGLLSSQTALLQLGSLIGVLFVTLPMGLIVYGTNDIADRESDAQNPRKGGIDGVRLKRSENRPLAVAIVVTAVVSLLISALSQHIGLGLAMLAICVFAYTYSVKPVRLKNRPVLDSLSNGIWVVSIFMVGYWANVRGVPLVLPSANILIAIVLFGAALHALGAAMDYEVDKAVGDTTICVALGKTKTLLLCALAFLVCLSLVHGLGVTITTYLIVATILTASAIRYQSARYIQVVFHVIFLLPPLVIVAKQFLEQ